MILLTGATGFLGEFVLRELLERKHSITCFIRNTSNIDIIKKLNVNYAYGDLDNYESFYSALKGKDTLINIASLGFGHTPNILKACKQLNIKKTIFISTTSIFTNLNPHSKKIRLEAEELIKESNLNYIILRPTMIYGTEKDRNIYRLIKYLKKFKIIPILGNGNCLQQPVYVKDLANIIVKAFESNNIKKIYNISGAKAITYNEIVDTTARILGKKIIKIHIPMKLSYYLLKIYEKISKIPKLKAEQVLRLNEDKAFPHEDAKLDLGYSPLSFEEGIILEIKEVFK